MAEHPSHAILKHIYSYLEVLEASHSKIVHRWSEESLSNALKWAHYCEQLHIQSCGKPYVNDLDEKIKKLNRKQWNLGGLHIHLGLLKDAKHHLTYALLHNPYLDAHLYAAVVKTILAVGPEAAISACSTYVQPKAVLSIVGAIRDETSFGNKPHTETTQSLALLLYQYLGHVIRTVPSGPRTDTALKDKLDQLLATASGFEVLLWCLKRANKVVSENSEPNKTTIPMAIQQSLVAHTEVAFAPDTAKRYVSSVPVSLMSEIAALIPRLFNCYIQYIASEAHGITMPNPWTATHTIEQQDSNLIVWTYNDLLSRLLSLQDAKGPASPKLENSLSELCSNSDSPVLRKACRELFRL